MNSFRKIIAIFSLAMALSLSGCSLVHKKPGVQVAHDYVASTGFHPLKTASLLEASGTPKGFSSWWSVTLKVPAVSTIIEAPEQSAQAITEALENLCAFPSAPGVEERWLVAHVGQWKTLPINSLALSSWKELVPLTEEKEACHAIGKQVEEWAALVSKTMQIKDVASTSANVSVTQLAFTSREGLLRGYEAHHKLWPFLGSYNYSGPQERLMVGDSFFKHYEQRKLTEAIMRTLAPTDDVVVATKASCADKPCKTKKLIVRVEESNLLKLQEFSSNKNVLITSKGTVGLFGLEFTSSEAKELSLD